MWALSAQNWVDPRAHGSSAVCPLSVSVCPPQGDGDGRLNRSVVRSRCMRAIVSGSSQDDLTTKLPADPVAAWAPGARIGKAMESHLKVLRLS